MPLSSKLNVLRKIDAARPVLRCIVVVFTFSIPALGPRIATAQSSDEPRAEAGADEKPAPQSEVTAPQLLHFVEVPYPEQAKAERLGGTTVLALTIGAGGVVTESEVYESSGYELLDVAARDTALALRFEPATKNGEPVAARILYAYEFTTPVDEGPPVAAPLPSTVAVETEADNSPTNGEKFDDENLAEVIVRGKTKADRMRESAEAVHVVEIGEAQRPRPDEIFGDGAFVTDNLGLKPEISHNANCGLTAKTPATHAGTFRGEVNGFLRETDQLIVLLGNEQVRSYQNVLGARSLGAEGALGWSAPKDYLALDGNLTYFDLRNTSSEGIFGDFQGDRIPNRPYLFANGSARFQVRSVAAIGDELSLTSSRRGSGAGAGVGMN